MNNIPVNKFIIVKGSVLSVYEIAPGSYVHGQLICDSMSDVFDNKDDALFANFLNSLRLGRSLDNYKSSPYFSMYIERLKRDHPEYLI